MFATFKAGWAHSRATAQRILAGLLLLGLFGAGSAQAGYTARVAVIGFSSDGRYVAFEEYGELETSGIVFANVMVMDVATNQPVPGAPIRLEYDVFERPDLADDGVSQTRAEALAEAQPVLDSYAIVAGATGSILVHRPLSDLDAPAHEATFSLGAAYSRYTPDTNLLRLTVQELADHACDAEQLGPVATMSLTLDGDIVDQPLVLHQDDGLPDVRGCAYDYRIHSIVAYTPDETNQHRCCYADQAMLVLVSVAQFGFEGPDWRFIGVTTMLNDVW